MNIAFLDIIFLVPLIIYFIIGYRKGFIVEVFTVIALFVAVIGCLKLTNSLLNLAGVEDETVWWIPYLAYVIVFVAIFFIIHWLGKIFEKFIKVAQLSFINNIAGALLGGFKIIFLFSLFLWITDQTTLFPENVKQNSVSYKYLRPVAPAAINFISNNTHIFNNLVEEVEHSFEAVAEEISSEDGA